MLAEGGWAACRPLFARSGTMFVRRNEILNDDQKSFLGIGLAGNHSKSSARRGYIPRMARIFLDPAAVLPRIRFETS